MKNTIKNFLVICGVVMCAFAATLSVGGQAVFADADSTTNTETNSNRDSDRDSNRDRNRDSNSNSDNNSDNNNTSNSTNTSVSNSNSNDSNASAGGYSFTGSCREGFLGFVSWDCDVTISSDGDLGAGIWMVASNVATDIAMIAAYLVIGYVIYGGYLYTFSGGDPGKVATGKKTLVQAFTGLAITMLANVIVGAIRIALVGGSGNIGNCTTGVDACVTANELVENLINWVIRVIGVVSAAFLVYGGIQYITSAGDPTKLKRAKDTILYSLIGLAIVALATVITAFVSSTIRDANSETSININTTISKEVYDTKIN